MVTRIIATLLVVWCLSLPQISLAAGFIPCGGPDQEPCQACHMIDLTNNVISWLVLVLGTIAAIMIVFAGFKLVTSNGNQRAMEEAKEIMSNMVIGFVIVLAGWMLVDTVLKAVLKEGVYGVWNQVQCVDQPVLSDEAYEYETVRSFEELQQAFGYVSPDLAPDPYVTGDCSPTNLQRYGMNSTQSVVFSCIAVAESGCNLNSDNENSSARGVFQILRGWDDTCHNLNIPACISAARAAGFSGSSLRCSEAFRGGQIRPGYEAQARICDIAASNMACNTAAALCLYNDGGGYGHWLGTDEEPHMAQRACVAKYAR